MAETQLTGRGIFMVVLVFVMLMAGMMLAAFFVAPTANDPIGSRNMTIICAIVCALALMWFIKLSINSVRDRRKGISKAPAQESASFNVWFGTVVAVGGITCSVLTYRTSSSTNGTWKLYWGMIAWGLVQSMIGFINIRRSKNRAVGEVAPATSFLITEGAKKQILLSAKSLALHDGFNAIVGMKPDGSLSLDLSNESLDSKEWTVFKSGDINVAVDRTMASNIHGFSLDWLEQDGHAGFVFAMQG